MVLQYQEPHKVFCPNILVLGHSIQFGSLDNLYCRYTLSFGNDWYIVHVSTEASRRNSSRCLLLEVT